MNKQDLFHVNKYTLVINKLLLKYNNLFTSELCLIAVKINKYALRFIDCQTDEIYIAAIKLILVRKCDDLGENKNGLSNR